MERNTFNQPTPIDDRNRICLLSFQLTDSLYEKSNPRRYSIEVWNKNELLETIALQNPESEQVMLLERSVGDAERQSNLPYKLSEQLMGIDTTTGEPCDIWQNYLLDTQGNFHSEIREGERIIIALCGPDQQARLTHFLLKANPVAFLQNNT